jgi:hypothetical protein
MRIIHGLEPTLAAEDGGARAEAIDALRALEAWGSDRHWIGSDPYDGLNATRLVSPLLRSRRGRQAVTQLVKRSALDLRPLLGIPSQKSAAALAQVASAYACNRVLPSEEAEEKLGRAMSDLEDLRCDGFEVPCWGYHFDVQTRVFFYPKGAPNTIASSFAGMAALDAFEATDDQRHLTLAVGTAEFFLRHVPQTEDSPGAFFGYLVEDRTPIHNANMLVCAFLARLAQHTGRDKFLEAALAGVAYTVARQRPEGSWPYGERSDLQWIDNFHTGYVLECLAVCAEAGMDELTRPALELGLDFYRRELFRSDGAPKYLPSSLYPIDIQCAAQGIQTFARLGRSVPELLDLAWKVSRYAIENMRRQDGSFIFQRRRLWDSRISHVRWSASPMFLALTYLLQPRDDFPREAHESLD